MSALQAAGGLVGRAELAALWGVSRQRVAQLVAADDFPDPVGRANNGDVWLLDDCEAWRATRRPAGRPKTVQGGDPA